MTFSNSTPVLTFIVQLGMYIHQEQLIYQIMLEYHCAVVRDNNGTLRIFVDGQQEGSRDNSTNFIDVEEFLNLVHTLVLKHILVI